MPRAIMLWFKLGDAYRAVRTQVNDQAEKQKRLDAAVEAYQKASSCGKRSRMTRIRIRPRIWPPTTTICRSLCEAGKVDDAVKT